MWPFKKKEETVESLMNDCSKLYSDFRYSITLAHYKSYYEFKQTMNGHFEEFRNFVSQSEDEQTVKSLLVHFKEQLLFFKQYPFACEIEDFRKFQEKNFPYIEKLQEIVNQNQPKPQQNKLKV